MKKIYSLIALAFAAMSASADVVLTMGGQECDPSKTVEVYAEVENWGDEETPYYMIEGGMTDPYITNTGSANATVSATVTLDESTMFTPEGMPIFTWCFPDNCNPLKQKETTMTKKVDGTPIVIKPGASLSLALHVDFSGADEEGNFIYGPTLYASYSATVTIKEGSKSKTYTVKFIYDESCDEKAGLAAGINTVLRGEDNAVRYDLQGRRTNNTAAGLFIQNGRKFIK